MQGIVTNCFGERRDVKHSRQIIYCDKPEKLPVRDLRPRGFSSVHC